MGESHARLKRSVSQVSTEKNTDLGRCLEAIDLPKSTYYYRKNRSDQPPEEEQELMDHIREIIGEHLQRGSYYGYRRILPELEERTGQRVNHKRLRRLLSEHELGLSRHAAKHSPSPVQEILKNAAGDLNLVEGQDPGPLEAFSTDFTELSYSGGNRKAYLMAAARLESFCGSGLGGRAERQSKAGHALLGAGSQTVDEPGRRARRKDHPSRPRQRLHQLSVA
ncbi:IS3 family transposase [Salinibacter ruber]|uniref:IS3 family transposase n=1 Tax=Salinibacter ruber TaxID=146919 RepID=UPI0020738FF2|nr:IS3 family transposase [Salinibacter ruber]